MVEQLFHRFRAVVLAAMVAAGALVGHSPPELRLPGTLPRRTIELPILLYHRIGPVTSSQPLITQRLTVTPTMFAAQMRWLVGHGYRAVTELQAFDALEHGAELPRKPVLITFDDGYRDVLYNAAPVMHRLHIVATEFVITGRVSGPDSSFLTWPELARLEAAGVAIGSHTRTHADLPSLPLAQALAQLRDSRRALERHLGHPVQWFAYPFGMTSPAVVKLVQRAGYVLAMTEQPGNIQSARAPLLLRRDEVLDTTSVAGVAAMLAA